MYLSEIFNNNESNQKLLHLKNLIYKLKNFSYIENC